MCMCVFIWVRTHVYLYVCVWIGLMHTNFCPSMGITRSCNKPHSCIFFPENLFFSNFWWDGSLVTDTALQKTWVRVPKPKLWLIIISKFSFGVSNALFWSPLVPECIWCLWIYIFGFPYIFIKLELLTTLKNKWTWWHGPVISVVGEMGSGEAHAWVGRPCVCTGKAHAHTHTPPSTQSSGAHKEASSVDLLCLSLGTCLWSFHALCSVLLMLINPVSLFLEMGLLCRGDSVLWRH